MSFSKRSYEKELLDADNIPFTDMLPMLQELNMVNTLLGGHKITRRGVDFFLKNQQPRSTISIAEIGCGGGDNLTAIDKAMQKSNRPCQLTGIDIKEECIEFAKQNCTTYITWICSDYSKTKWPADKPDIIFSSLFCHHFTDEQLVLQLQWMKANSRLGFFINDLHRHPLAYYSISLLTKVFSKSYLVKYDGPLSVKRAFKKKDWEHIFSAAGIANYSIRWQWAFRYLICVNNEQ